MPNDNGIPVDANIPQLDGAGSGMPQVSPEEAERRRNAWMDGLIRDGARDPLRKFEQSEPEPRAMRHFLWYHVLRPCLLVAFWLFVLWYVWANFFDANGAIVSNSVLLSLYLGIISAIFLLMLVLAPLRMAYQHRTQGRPPQPAKNADLASYAALPEEMLDTWQRSKMAIAYHGEDGSLRKVDVLVDPEHPQKGQLARLLSLLKDPGNRRLIGAGAGQTALRYPER